MLFLVVCAFCSEFHGSEDVGQAFLGDWLAFCLLDKRFPLLFNIYVVPVVVFVLRPFVTLLLFTPWG